jgi:hypothetical protein
VAGVGQPTFVDQPRHGRCEITDSDTQRFECFSRESSSACEQDDGKTIVEVLL